MWQLYVTASLFALLSAIAGVSTLLALPGIWLMVLLAVVHELAASLWLGRAGGWVTWTTIGVALVIAFAAEVIEFLAGAAGAKAGGASKWGTIGALVGGIVGALVGTVLIPLPLIGTLAGAALGAAIGASTGEIWKGGKSAQESIKPALGAAGGRVAGTLLKVALAAAVWVILVFGAFWR
ncbi:MAG: DUF456 domain-containing protein [Planctomycetes bacterium]|nr:DUF456 domain-containing protein [Planctomycetota bacterium]